ncbi:phosphatidylglycerol lysyltransferase domain-containing protein, partial [Alistipes putredinis]|nr:phosphatidylglycerol lysyltransferase domain-containing protein [Alistipes putredinis]
DYIYDGESLITLAGRKNQKKINHLNSFVKEYGDRVEYKKLEEADFDECINLLKEWSKDKDESIELDSEFKAIKRIFKNYEKLKDTL